MPERRLSFLLVSTLLTIALGGWILTAALQRTIGEPEQAKQLLNKSGVYQAVIPSQLVDAQQANPGLANLPLTNPQVQKVLGNSLDSQKLQAEGDKAVDGIYSWLEGESPQPHIAIDVQPDQQALSTSLGEYAAKHAATLPACIPGQDDYSNFAADPISATCLPPGVTPEIVRDYVMQAVSGNPALAVSTQLNQNDVKLPNGMTIMDTFKEAPVWYQRAQLLPLIFAAAAVFLMLLLLLILKPAGAARSTAKHLLSVGITLAICAALLAWGTEKLYSLFIPKSDNPNIGDAIMQLTNAFNNSLRGNIVFLSAGMATAGLVLFVLAWILGRIHQTSGVKISKPGFTSVAAASPSKKPAKKRASAKKSPSNRKIARKSQKS